MHGHCWLSPLSWVVLYKMKLAVVCVYMSNVGLIVCVLKLCVRSIYVGCSATKFDRLGVVQLRV